MSLHSRKLWDTEEGHLDWRGEAGGFRGVGVLFLIQIKADE